MVTAHLPLTLKKPGKHVCSVLVPTELGCFPVEGSSLKAYIVSLRSVREGDIIDEAWHSKGQNLGCGLKLSASSVFCFSPWFVLFMQQTCLNLCLSITPEMSFSLPVLWCCSRVLCFSSLQAHRQVTLCSNAEQTAGSKERAECRGIQVTPTADDSSSSAACKATFNSCRDSCVFQYGWSSHFIHFAPKVWQNLSRKSTFITIAVLLVVCCRQKVRGVEGRNKWKWNTSCSSELTFNKTNYCKNTTKSGNSVNLTLIFFFQAGLLFV